MTNLTRIHVLHDTTSGYKFTQTHDCVRDGDILIVPSERVAGVMVGARPIASTHDCGKFHQLEDCWTWDALDELLPGGGHYAMAAVIALGVLGGIQPGMIPLDRHDVRSFEVQSDGSVLRISSDDC